jgi:sporulation protein YlmC with PRC-barrel domain
MKNRLLLATFAATSLLAGSAFAADSAMGGITMADHASMAPHFVTTTPSDMMSSKLVGMNVYNNQNDKLGEVEDLVIDNGKTLTGVVVSVGGFLGMDERYVLIDPASIVVSDKDGTMKAVVDTNKDSLKAAPAFTYKKKSS